MDNDLSMKLYAEILRKQILNYIEQLQPDALIPLMESEALAMLSEIKSALDDESLDDPACLRRVEAVIEVFEKRGVCTARHDW